MPNFLVSSGRLLLGAAAALVALGASGWGLRRRRKQATERELRSQIEQLQRSLAHHERLARVAQHTNHSVIITDGTSRIEWVNDGFTRLTGYSLLDVYGRKPSEFLLGPASDPAVVERIRACMAAGEGFDAEIVNYTKEGRAYWASIEAQVVRDRDGHLTGFVATSIEITARKNAEAHVLAAKDEAEQLNQQLESAIAGAQQSALEAALATQAKSSFLATMSHEIRTPMNGIIGMSALLRETGLDDQQRDYLRTIETSGESLLTIINDILDYSKIEAGKIDLERVPVDLRLCLEDAMDLLVAKAQQKRIELTYQMAPDVPSGIRSDVTRLRQILVNLLSNAVKFTAKGEVVVRVRSLGHNEHGHTLLEFSVQDSGIGIPPDRRERLFQPFSQVDSSTTRKYGGTGLGLVISARLAEAMGGRMWVESTQGRGSTFLFTIATEPCADFRALPTRTSHPDFDGLKALIVDDNAVIREVLRSSLQTWGVQVTEAANADECLNLLGTADKPFDFALVDQYMPDLDGRELAFAMHRQDGRSQLPLVLMSVLGHTERSSEFATQVAKPVKPFALFDALNRALGRRADTRPQFAPVAPKKTAALPLTILVAEDNLVNQRVITLHLKKCGYDPDVVANGREVLAACATKLYDVILMDMEMPEMDGCEATTALRATPGIAQPWIIALTANAMSHDRQRALNSGMDDFLTKPLRSVDLTKAFERAHAHRSTLATVAA